MNETDLSTSEIKSLFERYVIANYSRNPIAFVRGEGSFVWDAEGNRYIDLMPGWGTTTIGHCHPAVVEAIQRQAARLIHVDNTFYNVPQGLLARKISEHSFGGKCFFCNSGAEAVEGAIKLARLHAQRAGRYKIITMENSFHGRTLAAITATGQSKYHKGYLPLVPGFVYVPFNDMDALRQAADDQTCAVMLEPVQGEGGINVAEGDYMRSLRQFCDERGLLLILDEVQTCMGRTARWFAYQHYGVEPDIMVLAKALGGGVAIGALTAKQEVAQSLVPGTHASTFGGNPLACAAGLATFDVIERDELLSQCRRLSEYVFGRLRAMASTYGIVKQVRGMGLMCGVELRRPCGPVFQYCLEKRVRINCTHQSVLRLLPAMNIPQDVLQEGLDVLEEAIGKAERSEL